MKEWILITGGAGFIGSHLADFLLKKDYAVICMDNLITGDIANISHIYNKDFLFIKHDVTQFIYVDKPLRYILHFASPASPIDYYEYPIQTDTLILNLMLVIQLFYLKREHILQLLIFTIKQEKPLMNQNKQEHLL